MHLTTKGSQFFSLVHLVGSDHAVCRGDEEIYRGQHPVPYPFTRPAKSLISSPSGTFLSLSQLLNLTFFPNGCNWNQAKNQRSHAHYWRLKQIWMRWNPHHSHGHTIVPHVLVLGSGLQSPTPNFIYNFPTFKDPKTDTNILFYLGRIRGWKSTVNLWVLFFVYCLFSFIIDFFFHRI